MHRRRVLTGLAATLPLIAGCSSLTGSGDNDSGTETTQASTTTTTTTSTATTMAETATQARTQTATQTATAAPTPTTTPVPTQTRPTASQPTAQFTSSGPGQTGFPGGTDLNFSNLKTYTNNQYPYTIDYPAGWKVNVTSPKFVMIQSMGTNIMIQVRETSISSPPDSQSILDNLAQGFLKGVTDSANSTESVSVKSQQDLTLSNNNPAKLLDTMVSTEGIKVRQITVLTYVDGIVYSATFSTRNSVYTDNKKKILKILKSLTIS